MTDLERFIEQEPIVCPWCETRHMGPTCPHCDTEGAKEILAEGKPILGSATEATQRLCDCAERHSGPCIQQESKHGQ